MRAETPEEFYKNKTVTLVIGFSAGGGFDLYARSFAKHFRNNMVGSPNVVVQNMPGAGSLTATNYIANVAPRDGSVFGLARAPVMELLAGTASSAFDPLKLTWIGNGATDLTVCGVMNNPQVKTMADAQKNAFTLAGLGPGSDEDMFTKVLNNLFQTKAKLVNGYPAGSEAMLAVERGEVDGRCGWSLSTIQVAKPDWITSGKLSFITALSIERSPRLPDTPSILEFATTDRQRQIMTLVIGSQVLGRPFFAPPGIPADGRRRCAQASTRPWRIRPSSRIASCRMKRSIQRTLRVSKRSCGNVYATPSELVEETQHHRRP